MGAEWELKYHPLNKPIPEGWQRHNGLDGSHHGPRDDGTGFTFIVKESVTLCQCGQPLKTEDRGHHVVTLCCGIVVEGCCGDV